MKIPTIVQDSSLFIVHRDKAVMQDKMDKRRSALLTLAIFATVSVGVILWILQ